MATDQGHRSRSGILNELTSIPGRAAAAAMRPAIGAMGAAVTVGLNLERRAVDRVLNSAEVERILIAVFNSDRVQAGLQGALESDGARRVVDTFFDSGLLDQLLTRLPESDALWRLIDEIAGSPAVTAAISQQGLGFADQLTGEVRQRSRKADDWLERTARRLAHRHQKPPPAAPEASRP